jgi:hypothetical protein
MVGSWLVQSKQQSKLADNAWHNSYAKRQHDHHELNTGGSFLSQAGFALTAAGVSESDCREYASVLCFVSHEQDCGRLVCFASVAR